MTRMMSALLLLALTAGSAAAPAAGAIDVAGYLRQQGWEAADQGNALQSPVPDVAPLVFYAKGASVPSCGLLTASVGAKALDYIELVGPDPEAGFPQCIGIKSMTPFTLQNREYLAVGYLARETREDTDVHFHYLVRDRSGGFITDAALTEAVPSSPSGLHPRNPVAVKPADGVSLARIAVLGRAYPAWRFMERDFISDKASSFSIFEDKAARRCQFVTEAGAAPLAVVHTSFAPETSCDRILASSRLEKGGSVYYLAMFAVQGKRQLVGVISVAQNGDIGPETALSNAINRAGATKNMVAAKAALMRQLQ